MISSRAWLRCVALLVIFGSSFPATPHRSLAGEGMVSETTATWASALGTLVPVTAGVLVGAAEPDGFSLEGDAGTLYNAGLLLGPSVGHFYAREPRRALLGIGLRTLGFSVAWLFDTSNGGTTAGNAAGTLGVGLVFASALADIAGAKKSARRHNLEVSSRSERRPPGIFLAVRPSAIGIRVAF